MSEQKDITPKHMHKFTYLCCGIFITMAVVDVVGEPAKESTSSQDKVLKDGEFLYVVDSSKPPQITITVPSVCPKCNCSAEVITETWEA